MKSFFSPLVIGLHPLVNSYSSCTSMLLMNRDYTFWLTWIIFHGLLINLLVSAVDVWTWPRGDTWSSYFWVAHCRSHQWSIQCHSIGDTYSGSFALINIPKSCYIIPHTLICEVSESNLICECMNVVCTLQDSSLRSSNLVRSSWQTLQISHGMPLISAGKCWASMATTLTSFCDHVS